MVPVPIVVFSGSECERVGWYVSFSRGASSRRHRMSRRADLESQIAALRDADATLEKRLASQDEKIDEYERRGSVSEASGGSPLAFDERMPVVGPAILAVALMLETRAATMAIGKGCDIA